MEAEPQGRLLTPITDAKLSAPPITGSLSNDSPVPIDSDAEAAYVNGSARGHRSHHGRRSTTQVSHLTRSAGTSNQDLRRLFAARRRWPVNRSPDGESGDDIPSVDYGRATPDPPPEQDPEEPEPPVVQEPIIHAPSPSSSPSALFKRLRKASFSPFASIRQRSSRSLNPGNDFSQIERAQSSESSSDDDDLSILSRRVWAPSTIRVDSDEPDDGHDS